MINQTFDLNCHNLLNISYNLSFGSDTLKLKQFILYLDQYIKEHPGVIDFEKILQEDYTRFLKEGDIVFDVGAHHGRHLKEFISLVGNTGQIQAFEPLPDLYNYIVKQYGQSHPNLKIYNVALGDSISLTEFVFAEGTPEESGLKRRIYNFEEKANPKIIIVQKDRLDSYTSHLKRIDFIKIDIEGGEMDLLKSSVNTLNRFRPILSVEYGFPGYSSYGYKKEDLFLYAKKLNYKIVDLFGNEINTITQWQFLCDSVYWDYFLCPEEKIDWFLQSIFK